jgi:Double zinc ribbon
MEQRFYHGNIDPNGLADYLVSMFDQGSGMYNQGFSGMVTAQKVGQGDHLLVQIARVRHSGRIRNAIGVSIARTADGASVSTGQSNWLDDGVIGGGLIGALFWPPLLLFPLARGIRNFAFYQDIWNAVDTYCTQAGATQGNVSTAHGVYCSHCGTVNEEGAEVCAVCGSPLYAGQPQQSQQQQTPQYQPPAPSPVVCPKCGHTVASANFCSNCAASLPTQG